MFKKLISAGILAVAAFSASANTTIEVPDGGSSGVQTFTFTFGSDFDGDITFGVSNEGDTGVESTLTLFDFFGSSLVLNTSDGADTSAYLNSLGEAGTTGDLFTLGSYAALAGDIFTFDWEFSTIDYAPFNDFAFVDVGGDYFVLAEISAVPEPSSLMMYMSGLIVFAAAVKRRKLR